MSRTIKDVARKARVSITTVSRVVNNQGPVTPETREKVLAAIEALEYTPNFTAKRMRNSDLKTIGVVVPDISDLYYSGFVNGIQEKANETDCRLIICCSRNNIGKERDYVKYLYNGSVDGLIFISPCISVAEINTITAKQSVVVCGNNLQLDNVQSIISDNVSGGYQAVKHFHTHQIKKIAYIGGVAQERDYTHWERLSGYQKGMAECGLEIMAGYIENGYYTKDGGEYAFTRLMNLREPPEAVFCINDKVASGVIKAARKAGIKVPEELKLIGFDNTAICEYTTPTLTSLDPSTYQIGTLLFEKLMTSLNQPESRIKNEIQVIYPRLVIRESCGCVQNTQPEPVIDLDSNRIIINDNITGDGNYQFEYCGMWNYSVDPEAYQEDNHWSFIPESYCLMRFYGTQLRLYAARDPRHGMAAISVDGGEEVLIDCFGAKRENNVILYTSPELPQGDHLLKIRVTGQKSPESYGTSISIDKVEVII